MGPDRILRFAVLGAAGFAEEAHIPGLNAHPRAEVVALYSGDLERARAMAGRTGVPEATDDLDALMRRLDIDAVTVVSANDRHHPYAMAALANGKHVLCDKPMALDASQAEEMTRAAESAGVVHQIAFTFRYTYCMEELRRRVSSGAIGEPHYVEVHNEVLSRGALEARDATWRDDASRHGAGHLGEMGVHFIDTINYLCGPAKGFIAEVAAVTVALGREVRDAGGARAVDTLDLSSFLVRTEGGLQGQVLASRVTPPPVSYGIIHAGERQRGHMGYVIVTGDKGALMATFTRGEVEALHETEPGGHWEPVELPPEAADGTPHGVARMMYQFVDNVLAGRPDGDRDATFVDGYRSQSAVDAVMRAGQSRRWEPVATALD